MERPTLLTFTSSDGEVDTESYVKATMDFYLDGHETESEWDLWPGTKVDAQASSRLY